jgi:hypothetical protein
MELLEIFGYISALAIGISLGLIGGGGSILAVPVLAYLFSVNEKVATAYSLFIVGASALVGGFKQHFKGYVDWKTAFVFGLPAIVGVTTVRHYIVPALPDVLFLIGTFELTRRMAMFGLFAVLMFPAAFSMLKKREEPKQKSSGIATYNVPLIIIEGLLVGAITGLIGAGGGFLIIPALVLLAHIDMKVAVGTSLMIIAFKSLLGFFLGDALTMEVDWIFLSVFTGISFVGIFIGGYLSNFIDGYKLKKGFGYFIFVMAFFIFYMEFFVKP